MRRFFILETAMTTTPNESAQDLRRRAEELFRTREYLIPELTSPEETKLLLHELQVNQIELEMQNDELRRSHAELDSARASYFDLYDLAPVGYLTLSDEGVILKANLFAATMIGVERAFLLQKRMSRFIFPEDQDVYSHRRTLLIDNCEIQNWEMRLKRGDGSPLFVELRATLAQNGENWIILKDITERKRTEEELLASETLYRLLTENVSDVVWKLDKDFHIKYVSPADERMRGYRAEEIVGCSIFSQFTDDGIALIREKYRQRQEDDRNGTVKGAATFEVQQRCKDGSLVWTEIISTPERDANGTIIGFNGISRDVTERKRAEEEKQVLEQQLQQTQKLESLGVLSGGIAHDFNNILAIIIGYCALTKLNYGTAEKNIPIIEDAAERAAGLCRQMLAYAGKAQLTKSKINMVKKVEDIVGMLKETLPQNAVIKTDLSAEIPIIEGDTSQLTQVAMNLIINASEAIGTERGAVDVSLARIKVIDGKAYEDYHGKPIPPGEYVCLEVTDNGCGMDDATKWRIFEPFFTTKFTGRGLGMSAVLGIIKSHAGALQLFSKPGRGTTFKVYLPVPTNEAARDEDQAASVPVAQWRGIGTILLAEDEDQVRDMAKNFLELFGFNVLEAVNGKDALELYQNNAAEITLVLTDMGMPVMDGYELFSKLKKLNPELPIIVSSGYGDAEVSARIGSDNNIAGLISKPYNSSQLREVLKSVVEGVGA